MSKATVAKNPYDFKLILIGLAELNPEIVEKLGAAGLEDANLCARKGVVTADFEREAESFDDAVLSAMADIHKADVGVTGIRFDRQDDAVSLAEVARRIGKTRQAVSLYAAGKRGVGYFPSPIIDNSGEPLYSWADVADWLRMNNMLPTELSAEADCRASMYHRLESMFSRQHRTDLLKTLNTLVRIRGFNGLAEFNARLR